MSDDKTSNFAVLATELVSLTAVIAIVFCSMVLVGRAYSFFTSFSSQKVRVPLWGIR